MSLKYWTCWNFTWASMEHLKMLPYTPNLQTSLITTSIMGGYITYASIYYDKPIKIRIGDFRWKPNIFVAILGDFIFHHMPIILAIKDKKFTTFDKCSRNSIVPVLLWYSYINMFYINPHKFYNRNIDNLLWGGVFVYLIQGLIGHRYMIKN